MSCIPSEEQLNIINIVKAGHNISIDSVAGAGKSTTSLLIAEACPDKKIASITYSAALKFDGREKVAKLNLTNIDVHSFHSLASTFYKAVHDDAGLYKIVENDLPLKTNPQYAILILDESQDMTDLLQKFIRKLIKDIGTKPQLVVFGDYMQNVYAFKGSDFRYLTMANKVFKDANDFEWREAKLSYTYRLTKQIATFINKYILDDERLITTKNGPKINYIYMNAFYDCNQELAKIIKKKIDDGEDPNEICVLCYSVKNPNHAIRKLEHKLVEFGIPCYIPSSDDNSVKDVVIKGKVVFSSLNQSKGKEYNTVIIYGFDDFYYKDEIVPNSMYVGLTRSKNSLYLVHHYQNGCAKFLSTKFVQDKDVKILRSKRSSCNQICESNESAFKVFTKKTEVTTLVQHLPDSLQRELSKLIDCVGFTQTTPYLTVLTAETHQSNVLIEEVSDLNGIAIPAVFEMRTQDRKPSIYTEVEKKQRDCSEFFKSCYANIPTGELKLSDMLYLATVYSAMYNNTYSRISQIKSFDWLTDETMDECYENLCEFIPLQTRKNLHYEVRIGKSVEIDKYELPLSSYSSVDDFIAKTFNNEFKLEINGSLDMIDMSKEDLLPLGYEIKCTSELKIEHKLQICIYAWLWNHQFVNKYGKREWKLFNVLSKETWCIYNDDIIYPFLDQIMEILIGYRFVERVHLTNDKFIEKTKEQITFTKPPSIFEILTNSEKNKNKYLILDTETTGTDPKKDRVIQWSWQLTDYKFVDISEPQNHYIYPPKELTKIPVDSTKVHHITLDDILTKGKKFNDVVEIFMKDLNECTHIVAHNADFDLTILTNEFNRYGCYTTKYTFLEKTPLCTMRSDEIIDMVGAKNSKGTNKKFPRLEELYMFALGKPIDNAHDSLYDVLNLRDILFEIYTNKMDDLRKITATLAIGVVKPKKLTKDDYLKSIIPKINSDIQFTSNMICKFPDLWGTQGKFTIGKLEVLKLSQVKDICTAMEILPVSSST